MAERNEPGFDHAAFLANAGRAWRVVHIKQRLPLFSQGDPAEALFYLQRGQAKLTVVSMTGKEATITLLRSGDFVGEDSLFEGTVFRTATATAITRCTALRIEKAELFRLMHDEHTFSDLFLSFLLARCIRTQADLVDQLFNSSEKRLARTLLLMAEFGKSDRPNILIPKISQETLAEMIGTTRSRVNFFMNRFRKLGLIEYNSRIRVHKSLLNLVLLDQLPQQNSTTPALLAPPQRDSEPN